MNQIVTASMLYNLVQCPHRAFLDLFGDPGARDEVSPFINLLWERGSAVEREVIARLDTPFLDLSSVPVEERESRTREAIHAHVPLIYHGRISADNLLGEPDLLRLGDDGYIPIDIKSGAGEEGGGSEDEDGKPKLHYAVQLALYVDVLERIGSGSPDRRAFIWDVHGREVRYDLATPQGPRKPQSLWDEYSLYLQQARSILAQKAQPRPAYSSACKNCYWMTLCLQTLEAEDDLTLIPYLGRAKRDAMLNEIPTISALSIVNAERFIVGKKTAFPGIGPDTLKLFAARAAMLKAAPPKAYLRGPVALKATEREFFFDIEVDPMRDFTYLHGVMVRDKAVGDESFVAFFAEDESPAEERRAFAESYAFLTANPAAHIYYYSKYERTIYRKLQQRYPDVCTADEIEALFSTERATDLYFDVVLKATEWPTRDYSIKSLAKHLGFAWRDAQPSGAASIEWFDRWVKERDPSIRQRILEYNEDDCVATRVLLDGIRALA